MNDDPIVTSVRRVREELAAAFGYDVHAVFTDLRRQEAELGERLVRQSSTEQPNQINACESINSLIPHNP